MSFETVFADQRVPCYNGEIEWPQYAVLST